MPHHSARDARSDDQCDSRRHAQGSASGDASGHASRAYDRARDAFDALGDKEQARFLAETTVSAVARGVRTVSRALAGELDAFFDPNPGAEDAPDGNASRSSQHAPGTNDRPGPAEPPTGAQRRPG